MLGVPTRCASSQTRNGAARRCDSQRRSHHGRARQNFRGTDCRHTVHRQTRRRVGPDGHHTAGAIADELLAGSNAAAQVRAILGGLDLRDAAVWADSAKGVSPSKDFAYTAAGHFAECAIYETAPLEAEMSAFVRRNDTNCAPKPGEESCHKQYHYTDIAVQRDHYKLGSAGTRDDDIVAAVAAATRVLKGEPAPAPFDIQSPREALLLIAHYVGDIHRPLHVGAIYLAASGKRVDPDTGSFDASTETRVATRSSRSTRSRRRRARTCITPGTRFLRLTPRPTSTRSGCRTRARFIPPRVRCPTGPPSGPTARWRGLGLPSSA